MPNENVMVPYALLETELERHQEETRELRKHYSRIIYTILAILMVTLLSIISCVVWFFANCEIMTVYQDIDTGEYGEAIIEDGIHYNEPS